MTGMDIIRSQRGQMANIAAELGITRTAVSFWKRVPAERVADVSRITGLPKHDLRPDLFDEPTEQATS